MILDKISNTNSVSSEVIIHNLLINGYYTFPFSDKIRAKLCQYVIQYICSTDLITARHAQTFEDICDEIARIDNERFYRYLHHAYRYFPAELTESVLDWVVPQFAAVFSCKHIGTHTVSTLHLKKNRSLDKDLPSFYFRFVRARKGDVADAHLDKHYWELKDAKEHVVGPDFKAAQRWKLWIPLMGCNQSNMLRVMPKSHNVDIPFDIRSVAGEMKPQIEESWLKFNEHNFVCPFQNTNEAMVFHDELAHLAPVNPGPFARISAELTIFTSERLEVKAEPLSIPTAHSIG